jgi:hypothetical protein
MGVIDEYLVGLGFQVDESQRNQFRDSLKQAEIGAAKLGLKVAGTVAALAAMITTIAEKYEDVYYATFKTNASAASIEQFTYASKQIGIASSAALGSLESFNLALRTDPTARFVLNYLGVQTVGRQTTQMFNDLIGQLSKMPFWLASQWAERFNISPSELNMRIQQQKQEADSAADFAKRASEAGIHMGKLAVQTNQFMTISRQLESELHILALAVLQQWVEPMTTAAQKTEAWAESIGKALASNKSWGQSIHDLVMQFKLFQDDPMKKLLQMLVCPASAVPKTASAAAASSIAPEPTNTPQMPWYSRAWGWATGLFGGGAAHASLPPAGHPFGGANVPNQQVAGPGAAAVRYHNPGAQYPATDATKFGMTGYGVIGGGHLIARFPDAVHGAASNMDLYARKYTNMPIGSAGAKWTGNNSFGIPGYDPRTVVTPEMMKRREFVIPLMKSIAAREAGGKYPMTDAEWNKAFDLYMKGGEGARLDKSGHSSPFPPGYSPERLSAALHGFNSGGLVGAIKATGGKVPRWMEGMSSFFHNPDVLNALAMSIPFGLRFSPQQLLAEQPADAAAYALTYRSRMPYGQARMHDRAWQGGAGTTYDITQNNVVNFEGGYSPHEAADVLDGRMRAWGGKLAQQLQ